MHNPKKLRDLEGLLDQHAGSEWHLLQMVKEKYVVLSRVEKQAEAEAVAEQESKRQAEVLMDRFLGEIEARDVAEVAAVKRAEEAAAAAADAAEQAAVAEQVRLVSRGERKKERALRKEVDKNRPAVEQRKAARDALSAAAAALSLS